MTSLQDAQHFQPYRPRSGAHVVSEDMGSVHLTRSECSQLERAPCLRAFVEQERPVDQRIFPSFLDKLEVTEKEVPIGRYRSPAHHA